VPIARTLHFRKRVAGDANDGVGAAGQGEDAAGLIGRESVGRGGEVDSGCVGGYCDVGAAVDQQLGLSAEDGDEPARDGGEWAGVEMFGAELHKINRAGCPARGELQKLGFAGVRARVSRNGIADHFDKCSCGVLRNGQRGYDGGDTHLRPKPALRRRRSQLSRETFATLMGTVYDLIVIGSGPAGQRAAIYGAKLGKRVAVVESREVVGGACINTGTIPSKTMREAVLHLSGYNYKSIYGMNYRVKERITMADLAFRVQHVIKTEVDVTEAQLSRNNVEMLVGVASFEDATHVKVTNSRGANVYEAKNVLIATGTKPADSPKVQINGTTIVNSDLIMNLKELPKTMIIVGGGVIGVEYCCMFAALGVRVTLIERRPRLLEFADTEIVEALSYHLRDARVTMRLNEEVDTVEELADGTVVATLESKKKLTGDALLYAVGRQGNVDELNLAAAGIEADKRGRIPVDKDFRTKQPTVFAAGDVIGFPSLASVSMEQGRVAAARAFGDDHIVSNPSFYPYGIYTIPEISFIGKTEEQLTEEDVPYEVGVAYYREIARGQIRGDTTGRLKIIFHRETHSILGVHIIGEGASELLHIGQAVMALGGKLEYFVETVFNYPTLAECYKVAAFNGMNRVSKFD